MNRREQKRLLVLNAVVAGQSTVAEAAASLDLSKRQVRRVLAAYRKEGAAALAHGNRGRRPGHATAPEVGAQVVALAQTTYAGCNQQHLRDLLAEREQITLSRATVHRLLAAAGVLGAPTRRPKAHRRRRERRQQAGQLVQIDASPHAWLEGRGPRLSLLSAIDDATGEVVAALFRAQEDAHGYLLLLRQLVERHGRPLAVYHDRHSIFRPPTASAEPLADALAGRHPLTQVGRMFEELGITAIAAHSPQAKGRVERLFGTLQERLVVELRLAGADSLQTANAVLAAYRPRFNAQFAVAPTQPGAAYRPLEAGQRLETICCFKYLRVVGLDHVVTFAGQSLQIQPDRSRLSYARTEVTVHEQADGSVAVYYAGRCLHTTPAPAVAPVLRARQGRRAGPQSPAPPTARAAAASVADPSALGRFEGDGGRNGAGPDVPAANVTGRPRSGPPAPTHPWRRPLHPTRTTSLDT